MLLAATRFDGHSLLGLEDSSYGASIRHRKARGIRIVAACTPPYKVLITGASKGIGMALAEEFLRSGDNVMICSRREEHVNAALQSLSSEFGSQRSWGKACDVRDPKSIREMVEFARDTFGKVDIWINNAGSNGYTYKPLVETSDEVIMEIVETNLIGVMLCCREAIKLMRDQGSEGHIFNMDGAGADGRPTPRFAAYGATKRSITQFTKTLQAELSMQGVKNVFVHNLSPGMVTTDLLMSGTDTKQVFGFFPLFFQRFFYAFVSQAKFFINALAEPPAVAAAFLVPRIRSVVAEKNPKSTYIRFLTGVKAYSQILKRILFKSRKDRFVREED
ncbi:chlorophyll(ide) b reductase NOL, chloroplastic-like isoform X1 [Selaginella moellendorffii]|uniref:chlorophyll(ide) b reductase NOL, chloroplastic-like isoform X1 n=1 Tax=Selaginella moellendorffii TaxID=88036 RepID=UPI000D1CBF99|nr:chlorophyll(ide) b reductase NOL, chloroplastic-like isoform X1 [Selaginella moellendorffii]|eukprot:XP_024543969.1 chlorophyll(ide) b reductase NOL, chloroplastic-like isoform X1 [Selaginella moellendorffii]